jgi:hypothetical protein
MACESESLREGTRVRGYEERMREGASVRGCEGELGG